MSKRRLADARRIPRGQFITLHEAAIHLKTYTHVIRTKVINGELRGGWHLPRGRRNKSWWVSVASVRKFHQLFMDAVR